MLWYQKFSAKTPSHVVAAVAVLQCLSATPFCCEKAANECGSARTANFFHASFGACDRVPWNCVFNSFMRGPDRSQNSTEYGCDCPCCRDNGHHACGGAQLELAGNRRAKPASPARQWHTRISIGQEYPPTSRIVGGTNWVPSLTSTTARCSLLCTFLL